MSFQDGGVEMEQAVPKEKMLDDLKEQASLAAMRRMSGEGRESCSLRGKPIGERS